MPRSLGNPIMLRLVIFAAFLAIVDGLTCVTGGSSSTFGPSCSITIQGEDGEMKFIDRCFRSGDGSAGCTPESYAGATGGTGTSEPGCVNDACWCSTDDCNTVAWYTNFKATYKPPPVCYSGIGGADVGPTCQRTQLYMDRVVVPPNCYGRLLSATCVENNIHIGMGDGCGGHTDSTSCESYQPEGRDKQDPKDSFDGSDRHCRWIPAMISNEKKSKCEVDNSCTFYTDRGSYDESSKTFLGECSRSTSAEANVTLWQEQRGVECEDRLKFGCNGFMGSYSEACKSKTEQATCLAYSECNHGLCYQPFNATVLHTDTPCDQRHGEFFCLDGAPYQEGLVVKGCSFKRQCCDWTPEPVDKEEACLINGSGTLSGVCGYHSGEGAPALEIVKAAFEQQLFTPSSKFETRCAMVASFRAGKGSATVLGSDVADLIGAGCKSRGAWESLAEHIGHTKESIAEYCSAFIPEATAMAALALHSLGVIIAQAKQGRFATVMPGLKDQLFIVTAKPEYGECLFTAGEGYGAAVCTCEHPECNNQTALEFIVNPEKGPMRLLQFLDGSLSGLKDAINLVAPGLLDNEGRINGTAVADLTLEDVREIMKIDGVAQMTSEEELWGISQDFQRLQVGIASATSSAAEKSPEPPGNSPSPGTANGTLPGTATSPSPSTTSSPPSPGGLNAALSAGFMVTGCATTAAAMAAFVLMLL